MIEQNERIAVERIERWTAKAVEVEIIYHHLMNGHEFNEICVLMFD